MIFVKRDEDAKFAYSFLTLKFKHLMKKLFVLAILTGGFALTSCNGNTSNTTSQAGEKIDSLVNQATSAVRNTADSVARGAKNATDSAKATIDSAVNGDN